MAFFFVAVVCNSVKINVRFGQKIIFGNCFSEWFTIFPRRNIPTSQPKVANCLVILNTSNQKCGNLFWYPFVYLQSKFYRIMKGFERKQTSDFIYRNTCKLEGNLCQVICNAIFGLWKELMPMTKSHVVIRLKQWCAWNYQKLRHRMRNFSAYMPSSLIFISLPLLIIHTSLSIYDEYPHYWGGTCLHV